MQHSFLCLAILLVAGSATQAKQTATLSNAKLKRDAGLSYSSHGYHGPSYKYLPPAATPLSHSSYEHGYHALHGNSLSANSGYDYSQLDGDSHHQTHYHVPSYHQHAHHVARPAYSSYHHAPKVETYIVQSSSHGSSSPHAGYKYASHGSSSSSIGSYASLLGTHKPHSGYLLPSSAHQGFGYHAHHSRPSYVSNSHAIHAASHGPAHGPAHGHGYGYAAGPSHVHAPLDLDLNSLSHGAGYHYAPSLPHELGEQPAAGYSYEPPSLPFEGDGKPINSYGAPLLHSFEPEAKEQHAAEPEDQPPAYALGHKGLGHFSYTPSKPQVLHTDAIGQHPVESHASPHHHTQAHALAADTAKAAFKPSTFLGAKPDSSGNSEEAAGYDYAAPSAQFLQPPTSGGGSGNSGGGGYDYQTPTLLYAAPGHAGDSATPIFEPDSTYTPPAEGAEAPQISYVPAAAPNHSYHQH